MIPKIIHYCWLSNDPIPASFNRCIKSWEENLHGYQFILWNFDKFDKESSLWVKEAFDNKKYAFAADYIRLYALYHYGGIYLDMDVEVIKPFDDLLDLRTMICFENSNDKRLEVAAFGVEKHSAWIKTCLDHYKDKHFVLTDQSFDIKVLPLVIRDELKQNNYQLISVNNIKDALKSEYTEKNIPVFPYFFFSPKSYSNGHIDKNEKTYSIHHFNGSWKPWYSRMETKICKALGLKCRDFLFRHIAKKTK